MVPLNPKLDIVFKMLFAAERNRGSLIALLTDVLQPAVPIESAIVLNPEAPRGAMIDKGPVLDLRVRLADGRHVHVEMQRSRHPSFAERGLYYWSRVHGAQLERGQGYSQLRPTIGVFFLDFAELAGERIHSVFQLRERGDGSLLTDQLELHYVELPKCTPEAAVRDSDPVVKWARFFNAETVAELEQLVMAYPELRESKETLEQLARDRVARELAELREHELATIEGDLRSAQEASREEGRAEGREEALRQSIATVCAARGIAVDATLQQRLRDADVKGLQRLLEEVVSRAE